MGGGMQFGKIGLKLDRMNLHALAERQNEEDVEEKVEPKQAGSFGSFGKKAPPPKPALKPLGDIRNEVDEDVSGVDKSQKEETSKKPEEEDSMMKLMGFGSFSSTHKSN